MTVRVHEVALPVGVGLEHLSDAFQARHIGVLVPNAWDQAGRDPQLERVERRRDHLQRGACRFPRSELEVIDAWCRPRPGEDGGGHPGRRSPGLRHPVHFRSTPCRSRHRSEHA